MTPELIDEAAQVLSRARQDFVALVALPEHCRPGSIAEGYEIQRAFMRIWRQPVVGWKIGATATSVQKLFRVNEPFYGPIHAGGLVRSPAAPRARDFQHLAVECEFAFRLGRNLPPGRTYARNEIMDALDGIAPAFEIVSPRFAAIPFDDVASAIADCGLNGGLVLGPVAADWRHLDLPGHKVRLAIDGALRQEGSGANVLGSPLNVLDWAVNAIAKAGHELRTGQLISTGTTTGVVTLKAGEKAVADFGTLGTIELSFL